MEIVVIGTFVAIGSAIAAVFARRRAKARTQEIADLLAKVHEPEPAPVEEVPAEPTPESDEPIVVTEDQKKAIEEIVKPLRMAQNQLALHAAGSKLRGDKSFRPVKVAKDAGRTYAECVSNLAVELLSLGVETTPHGACQHAACLLLK